MTFYDLTESEKATVLRIRLETAAAILSVCAKHTDSQRHICEQIEFALRDIDRASEINAKWERK